MTQHTHTPAKRAPRIATGILLASCVAAAPFLGASAAHAGGEGPWFGDIASVTKVSPEGAPLAGAVLEICAPPSGDQEFNNAGSDMVSQQAVYQRLADETSHEATIADAQRAVDTAQQSVTAAEAAFAPVAGSLLTDEQRVEHQAAIDAYAPIQTEQDALDASASEATATWQATVDEILALQEAGETVPAELAVREVEEQAAAEAAAQAAQDYRDAHVAEREAAQTATLAIEADADAQRLQEVLTKAQSDLDFAEQRLDSVTNNWDSSTHDMWQTRADTIGAQIDRNVAGGISTSRTVDTADLICYQGVSGADGIISVPVDSVLEHEITVTEITAPEGYVKINGTVSPSADGALTKGDLHFGGGSSGGQEQTYALVNEEAPEEPPAPPVTPPTEPPAPPVTPPETPTTPETPTGTLAYTGGDTTGAGWAAGIAATALAAGAALLGLRRRTRDAD